MRVLGIMADCLSEILKRLSEQLEALIASVSASQSLSHASQPVEGVPVLSWDGPLVEAIRQSDPKWFVIYVTQLRSRNLNVHLLVVSTLLCLQRRFKELLLSGNSILSLLCEYIKSVTDLSDVDVKLWFKECVYAFLKCSADKPRIVTPQMESAGLTFQDQEKLIKSIQANPQMANEAFGPGKLPSDEWSTEPTESDFLMSHLVSEQVVANLVTAKAAPALACIARVPQYRKLLVRSGGVRILIESESGDKEQNRVALARICITTNPSAWNPSQITDLANACHSLFVETRYELYQFEACVGLTNLLSYSDDIREYIMKKPGIVDSIFDTIGSCSNEQLRAAVAEVFCNLSLSGTLQSGVAENRFKEPIRILVFLTINDEDERLKCATSGSLAILTGNPDTSIAIEKFVGIDGFKELMDSVKSTSSPDLILRVLCIITNVIEHSEDEILKTNLRKILTSERDKLRSVSDNRVCEMLAQIGS